MSTNAKITLINHNQTLCLYSHYDGSPTGIILGLLYEFAEKNLTLINGNISVSSLATSPLIIFLNSEYITNLTLKEHNSKVNYEYTVDFDNEKITIKSEEDKISEGVYSFSFFANKFMNMIDQNNDNEVNFKSSDFVCSYKGKITTEQSLTKIKKSLTEKISTVTDKHLIIHLQTIVADIEDTLITLR